MSLLSNLKEFRNIKPCWASFSSNSLFGTKSKYKDNWPSAPSQPKRRMPSRGFCPSSACSIAAASQLLKCLTEFFAKILTKRGQQDRALWRHASLSSASYYPENQQSRTISWTPLAPFLLVNVVIMLDSLTVSSPLAWTNSKRNKALIVRNCQRS